MTKKMTKVEQANLEADWKESFRNHALGVSFSIQLTKAMMQFLCAVADNVQWDRALFPSIYIPDNWVATEGSLTRRGLIRRKAMTVIDAERESHEKAGLTTPSHCELTPAGEKIVELLKLAGIFVVADSSIQNRAIRKAKNA